MVGGRGFHFLLAAQPREEAGTPDWAVQVTWPGREGFTCREETLPLTPSFLLLFSNPPPVPKI